MPDKEKITKHKYLAIFGSILHSPHLWHLHRRSTARAFAVGLFCAMMPIPFQMILAAFLAIAFRANLPISVTLVWFTNPITMPAIFYFAYQAGIWLLQLTPQPFHFELSVDWLMTQLGQIWEPFLLGCFVLGTVLATISYFGIHLFWRWWVRRAWRNRG